MHTALVRLSHSYLRTAQSSITAHLLLTHRLLCSVTAAAACCQLDNVSIDKLKNPQQSSSQRGRERGIAILSYMTTNYSHHIDIEWIDHDHKGRVQKFWELLHKYIDLTATGRGKHTIQLTAIHSLHACSTG